MEVKLVVYLLACALMIANGERFLLCLAHENETPSAWKGLSECL